MLFAIGRFETARFERLLVDHLDNAERGRYRSSHQDRELFLKTSARDGHFGC